MAVSKKKTPTKGSVAFAALMPEHGNQKSMAVRLSVGQDEVSRWASGERKPTLPWRTKLLTELGIPLLDWDEPLDSEGSHAQAETFRGDRVA